MKKTIAVGIVGLLIVGSAGFYGGISYAKSHPATQAIGGNRSGFTGGGFRNANGRNSAGANFISGDVINKTDSTLTVQMRTGGSKIILISNTTPVNKMASGTLSDVVVGTGVSINGATNSDGTVTAEQIQIRPAGFASTTPLGR